MPVSDTDELREILERKRVAVVGCSTTPGKDAHEIPKYLLEQGYDVVPVNPFADEIFGLEAYDSLADVPGEIDIVDVFRPSDEVSDIVDAALERDEDAVIWLQLGIHDDEAVARAEKAGRQVVQDRCMKPTHQRLMA
ncbi:CoA-binding protein [Halomicroarcula sp. GCM10025324]|jgi:predicted CoA-binding protein|uniref:CoA-binding protein n=1 Tax=Haloarcula TaxID=2237 RepID=UPI0023E873A7|nr:CoA-binding protein [Halomicroarcula sp. ZS-22-S1]